IKVWGTYCECFKVKLSGFLLGKVKKQTISLTCYVVLDWQASPFYQNYPGRIALFGRNLFRENQVRLFLDGIDKETDIY
ncbi:MAG TPA: hypothetical protein VJL89_12230, partial [Thermodesulfovibrionia bacterium]|nr:hypothetical protein [Thermodesulfovibrionia bacterium]